MNPRPEGWEVTIEYVPAGVELKDRSVVVVSRPRGANEGNLVHHVAHVRKPVGYIDAILSALLMPRLHRV